MTKCTMISMSIKAATRRSLPSNCDIRTTSKTVSKIAYKFSFQMRNKYFYVSISRIFGDTFCFLLPIFSFSCACGEKKNEVQKNKNFGFNLTIFTFQNHQKLTYHYSQPFPKIFFCLVLEFITGNMLDENSKKLYMHIFNLLFALIVRLSPSSTPILLCNSNNLVQNY